MELKEKYTIIIVTHNMRQAVRIFDNTAFFPGFNQTWKYGKMFRQIKDKRTDKVLALDGEINRMERIGTQAANIAEWVPFL